MSKKPNKKPAARKSVKGRSWLGLLIKLMLVGVVVLAGAMAYLDAQIVEKFEGKRWAIPAKVYARPLEIYAGLSLTDKRLSAELAALGYRLVDKVDSVGQVQRKGAGDFVIYGRSFNFADGREPAQLGEVELANGRVQALRDGKGHDLPLMRLEPQLIGGFYPSKNEDRELVTLKDVPPLLVSTLIAVEDRNFYSHWGISLRGITRAMLANIRAGRFVQGGSTLTQQLVKNFYLDDNSRSLIRKLREAPMALLLEMHYSKQEILETYLNEVYLGQDGSRAIHGFGQASLFYFGQPVNELNPAQISLLVGMVKGPSLYNPRRNPNTATERRNVVLQVLADQGIMPQSYAEGWAKQPLGVSDVPLRSKGGYPAFMQLVRQQLQQYYDADTLTSAGLKVFTTLDPYVQHTAERSLQDVTAQLDKRYGKRLEGLEGAMIVTSPNTGEILAMVGGRDPRFQGFNRALDAHRQIGSLVKPSVYLSALEEYQQYNLATPLDDGPVDIKAGDGTRWKPQNFDHQSHGMVPLWQALAKSYNQSTAHLGLAVGLPRIAQTLQRLGITSQIDAVPSLLLGAIDLTPFEVTQMYQTIASQGFYMPLRAVTAVLDEKGKPLQESSLHFQPKQVVDPRFMGLVTYGMEQVVNEGTSRQIRTVLNPDIFAAGKTGTTNDQKDSWFAGFTENYLGVVWLGKDDPQPTPLTGATGALQVWIDMMKGLQPAAWQPALAPGLSQAWVDSSGNLTDQDCPGARQLPFIPGSEPKTFNSCHSAPAAQPDDDGQQRSWFQRLFGG
ncbi:penicillin-binding protein 1B [Pokkaliibacter plantistimulans]|uniref:Penicillin-binding protein 1B n=1 Tax=Proteobacteria bacterium 228 TaxID=2083153 RepID=A0A2S5KWM9_9PROT|nr:penicillin-binding protein 1B [Pokkaliibacter plantistimulans]PPC79105.1 penicillin-binding protein 1B [Pokkaliibacter plantistimulans]